MGRSGWGYNYKLTKDLKFSFSGRYRGHTDSVYVDLANGKFSRSKDTLFLSYFPAAFVTVLMPDSVKVTGLGLYKPTRLLTRRNKLYYEGSDQNGKFYNSLVKKRTN